MTRPSDPELRGAGEGVTRTHDGASRRARLLFAICVLAAGQRLDAQGVTEPFTIAVPDAVLSDLRERLERTRWPDQLPGTGWAYGADTAYLRELVVYWQNDFDWRAQERRLNRFHHYRAAIDGTRIHFIHERSRDPNATPLLILHGWPSSFVQMLDLIPLLTDPAAHGLPSAPSFHVVVASLPGFGFSDVPTRQGVGFVASAELMAKLMTEVLGYARYGVRGSDLGGSIVRQIALLHPGQVTGVHLTGMIGTAGAEPPFTPAEQAFIAADAATLPERAYARLQMSKPQTLAHSLNDSPVGLAAWIVEKFRAWSDSDGDVESRFSKDELLTNLMVYWVTGTAPASVRMYYEFSREPLAEGRIERPVGMLMTTRDLFPPAPREWGERFFNVTRWVETDVGGHFLEWEEPALVARELQAFFRSVASGRDGPAEATEARMITREFAERFAHEWIEAWNSHDLEQILSHYSDDFVMSSPRIAVVVDEPSGILRGKDAIRAYWKRALELTPALHFELVGSFVGADSIVLRYESVRGPAAEVFFFDADGKVVRAAAHYQ